MTSAPQDKLDMPKPIFKFDSEGMPLTASGAQLFMRHGNEVYRILLLTVAINAMPDRVYPSQFCTCRFAGKPRGKASS